MNSLLFKLTLKKVVEGLINVEDIKNEEIKQAVIEELQKTV